MKAYIIIGMLWGDESKGATVDFLTSKFNSNLNVRFNSGPQAAHNVISKNNIHHTFSQFGSGTLSGAKTLLSKYVLVNPANLITEAQVLNDKGVIDPLKNIYIDERCQIITPFHKIINRVLEKKNNHGSCGVGFGIAVKNLIDKPFSILTCGDLLERDKIEHQLIKTLEYLYPLRKHIKKLDGWDLNLQFLADSYYDWGKRLQIVKPEFCKDLIKNSVNPIFEGAQGVLLDQDYGFHPHTTWSKTTQHNAIELLNESDFKGEKIVIGCMRAYSTRHGNGPFVSQNDNLKNKPNKLYEEKHNLDSGFQKQMRVGYLDLAALKYSVAITKPDFLSISHLDIVNKDFDYKVCTEYFKPGFGFWNLKDHIPQNLKEQEILTKTLEESQPHFKTINNNFIGNIEHILNTKVLIKSYGPKTEDRVYINENESIDKNNNQLPDIFNHADTIKINFNHFFEKKA